MAKNVDQSVAKTFEMVSQNTGSGLFAARLKALSYVEAKRYCDSRIISRELTDNDFVAVIDFFDFVDACTEAGLCNCFTAERFFAPYANYQWLIFEGIAADMLSQEQYARADSDFGEGMKSFATSPTLVPSCNENF